MLTSEQGLALAATSPWGIKQKPFHGDTRQTPSISAWSFPLPLLGPTFLFTHLFRHERPERVLQHSSVLFAEDGEPQAGRTRAGERRGHSVRPACHAPRVPGGREGRYETVPHGTGIRPSSAGVCTWFGTKPGVERDTPKARPGKELWMSLRATLVTFWDREKGRCASVCLRHKDLVFFLSTRFADPYRSTVFPYFFSSY